MLFKKEKLKAKPLGYWEEKSYMIIIMDENEKDISEGFFERVEAIKDLTIDEKTPFTIQKPGNIKLTYQSEEYQVGFYLNNFKVPEMYLNNMKEEEKEKLQKSNKALTIFMPFNKDAKKSYHLQIKLALAMVPNLVAIMDESAEKLIPKQWVKITANTKVTPGPNDLFNVHAVTGENNEVWLHTHGLCRCGLTELEILQSDTQNYTNHYHVIRTLASFLIDKKEEFNEEDNSTYIGVLSNNHPIVVTCLPWTKGLKEYKKLKLGNLKDRKESHNSKTSIIFVYQTEQDEINKHLSKVSVYNDLWGDNPIFFISNEETKRMKDLAIERFNYVKEAFKNKENQIIIKIGLETDTKDNLEHIWFELQEIKEDKFKAKLIQEPYNIKNIKINDENWYTVDQITDWLIYTKNGSIEPTNCYLLEK